jgi:hypothetical protein
MDDELLARRNRARFGKVKITGQHLHLPHLKRLQMSSSEPAWLPMKEDRKLRISAATIGPLKGYRPLCQSRSIRQPSHQVKFGAA